MSLFGSFDVTASGLTAQRYRMDVIAENMANIDTTRTADGTPYRRKTVLFQEKGRGVQFSHFLSGAKKSYIGQGVKVVGTYEDTTSDLRMVYDPAHPDADENGYVAYPNVSTITEMTNLIDASRAYEANITAFNATKSMAMKGLEMANS